MSAETITLRDSPSFKATKVSAGSIAAVKAKDWTWDEIYSEIVARKEALRECVLTMIKIHNRVKHDKEQSTPAMVEQAQALLRCIYRGRDVMMLLLYNYKHQFGGIISGCGCPPSYDDAEGALRYGKIAVKDILAAL